MPSNCAPAPASGGGHFFAPRQPYQSTPYQRAYQATVDNKGDESKPPPKEVLKVLYAGQKLDKYDRYYTDQVDNKIFVGFLEIKLLCQRCGQSFASRSTLHKHLKVECVLVQNSVNATSLAQLSSSIPIL